jgi:hypothetical protein
MKNVPTKLKPLKLMPFRKVVPRTVIALHKGSKAAVVATQNGIPQVFVFDTYALLDLLSAVDEALVDKLSTAEYHDKSCNPAGWLIDTLESKLPLRPDFVRSLRLAIAEAQKKGWIPFEKIVNGTDLS